MRGIPKERIAYRRKDLKTATFLCYGPLFNAVCFLSAENSCARAQKWSFIPADKISQSEREIAVLRKRQFVLSCS